MNPLENFYEIIDDLKPDGKVKLAYDRRAKQICVIKERTPQVAELYQILKAIKISQVPEIYRLVEFENKLFVVEEYIAGRTLEEILKYDEIFSEDTAANIMMQISRTLELLHDNSIIHRDITPSNIMLTRDGIIKLIDFGISRIAKCDSYTDTEYLGTKGYAPPEQYGFGQTDARSDIYSLGVLIQRLLGRNYRGWLKKIINHCTQFDPDNRYDSAENLIQDLTLGRWQENLKTFKSTPAPPVAEPELSTGDKLEAMIQKLSDIDAMCDGYEKIEGEDPLRAKLIENAALSTADEFADLVYNLTESDIAEIRAALDEYPIKDYDSDTQI